MLDLELGLHHLDAAFVETQERTPKESALFYSQVISSNGGVLDGGEPREIARPRAVG